jgi:Zn-dependent protease with chaperone function
VLEAYVPDQPRHGWLEALGGEIFFLLAIFFIYRQLSLKWRRRLPRALWGSRCANLTFKGHLFSVALLLVFCIYLDFVSLIFEFSLLRNWDILRALLYSGLFFLHLAVVWLACAPLETADAAASFAGALCLTRRRLFLLLPMIFPWFVLALGWDLLTALWTGAGDFLRGATGYSITLSLLFLLMTAGLPPCIKWWWRCRPLPAPQQNNVGAVLQASGVKVADICTWSALGDQALSAAILGVFPRLRYLLITPKLIEVLSLRELQAVVDHEAGHIRYCHLLFYGLLFICYLLLALCLAEPLSALLNYSLYILSHFQWGINLLEDGGGNYWNVALSLPMLLLVLIYLRYVLGFFMRHFERQADFYALDFMRDPAPLADALNRIARMAAINPQQPSWHHFSIAQRVQALFQASPGQAARAQGRLLKRAALALGAGMIFLGAINLMVQQWDINDRLRQTTMKRLQEQQHQFNMQYFEAHSLWRRGQEAEAIASMEELLRAKPNNGQVLNDLAWFLSTAVIAQDAPRALQLALQAIDLHPDSAAFWDTLAQTRYANQQYKQAYAAAQTALAKLSAQDYKIYNNYYQMRLQLFKLANESNHEP